MVKLFELSETAKKAIVLDISRLLEDKYHVDNEDIEEFWNTIRMIQQKRREYDKNRGLQ